MGNKNNNGSKTKMPEHHPMAATMYLIFLEYENFQILNVGMFFFVFGYVMHNFSVLIFVCCHC